MFQGQGFCFLGGQIEWPVQIPLSYPIERLYSNNSATSCSYPNNPEDRSVDTRKASAKGKTPQKDVLLQRHAGGVITNLLRLTPGNPAMGYTWKAQTATG